VIKALSSTVMVAVLLAWVTSAQGATITYVESAIATGTMGSTPFTNASVTVTLTADTSTVATVFGGAVLVNPGSATVSVGGFGGPFTMLGSIEAFSTYNALVHGSSLAGIAQIDPSGPPNFTGILVQSDPALYGYNLRDAFGPIVDSPGLVSTGDTSFYATTGGTLHMTSATTSTLTVTGGDGTDAPLPGGPLGNPTMLNLPHVGLISSAIGAYPAVDYYEFSWAGGLFGASASVGTTNPSASYAFNLYTPLDMLLTGTTLNSTNGFSSSLSTSLLPGMYVIGLEANNPVDPAFSISFATPVSAVPEPATIALVGAGLAGVVTRYRRRRRAE
jgi:hypothetical protein